MVWSNLIIPRIRILKNNSIERYLYKKSKLMATHHDIDNWPSTLLFRDATIFLSVTLFWVSPLTLIECHRDILQHRMASLIKNTLLQNALSGQAKKVGKNLLKRFFAILFEGPVPKWLTMGKILQEASYIFLMQFFRGPFLSASFLQYFDV